MKLNLFNLTFITFFILSGIIIVLYFNFNKKNKERLTNFLTIFSSSMIILNLLMMVLNNYESTKLNEKAQIIKLNDKSISFASTVYNLFLNNKDKLQNLYDEIYFEKFEKPVNPKKVKLTFEERNVIFIIMEHIQNLFRVYYIQGGESALVNNTMYEGWNTFITQFFKSPKVQLFYITFKRYFSSFGFYKWIENKYIAKNNYFNINLANIDNNNRKKYSIN